jgi:protease-4
MSGDGMPSMTGFGKKIGVIKVEGLIMESRPVIEQIHRFRDDDSVTAVVLRVDSPGGTVGASQEIHSEVAKLAAAKPVVVSMGSVAASGGYYVSCPATVIFANPGTITGSIGVVMEVTNLEGLFAWMKVKNYVIKSGEFKDVGSPYREMTDEERKYLQDFVNSLHGQFEAAVSAGRNLSSDEVHEIADGRIYNGNQARDLGLIDEIGNLWDAIDDAAKRGGIEGEPRIIWPPRPRPPLFEEFFGRMFPGLAEASSLAPSPVRAMYLMNVN